MNAQQIANAPMKYRSVFMVEKCLNFLKSREIKQIENLLLAD